MRNTTCMIDYREEQHGLDALNRLFGVDKHKTAFVAALDECFPNSAQEAFTRFDKWWQNTLAETQPLNAY